MPSRSAVSISECATLLPSPTNASFKPAQIAEPLRTVCISASAWQGWYRSLSALITGTDDQCASASIVLCRNTRATMPFTQRSRFRATSFSGSRTPIGDFGEQRVAAQLLDRQFERQPRAQRRLFEQQRDGLAGQRPGRSRAARASRPPPDPAAAQFVVCKIEILKEIGSSSFHDAHRLRANCHGDVG